jgi:hypothetical protein
MYALRCGRLSRLLYVVRFVNQQLCESASHALSHLCSFMQYMRLLLYSLEVWTRRQPWQTEMLNQVRTFTQLAAMYDFFILYVASDSWLSVCLSATRALALKRIWVACWSHKRPGFSYICGLACSCLRRPLVMPTVCQHYEFGQPALIACFDCGDLYVRSGQSALNIAPPGCAQQSRVAFAQAGWGWPQQTQNAPASATGTPARRCADSVTPPLRSASMYAALPVPGLPLCVLDVGRHVGVELTLLLDLKPGAIPLCQWDSPGPEQISLSQCQAQDSKDIRSAWRLLTSMRCITVSITAASARPAPPPLPPGLPPTASFVSRPSAVPAGPVPQFLVDAFVQQLPPIVLDFLEKIPPLQGEPLCTWRSQYRPDLDCLPLDV